MPKVPTYQAQADIYSGATGPNASPDAFGAAGLGAVGQGLASLGQDVGDAAYRQKLLDQKQKNDSERQWMRSSATQLERVFAEFHDNEENQAKETFKVDFDEFAQKQIAEYSKNAPSKKSGDAFKTHMDGVSLSFSRSAGRAAARTVEANAIRAFDEQTRNALQSYRSNVKSGMPDAVNLLRSNVEGIYNDVESKFGKLSPDIAQKVESQIIRDVVLATAKHDPEFAKEILEKAPALSEQDRKVLLNHVESESETGDALAKFQANQILDQALDIGERGQAIPAIDERVIRNAHGKNADAILAQFKSRAQKLAQANGIVAELSDKNAGYQAQELAKLQPNVDTEVYNRAARQLEAIQRQQKEDPAGFLRSQNAEVQGAYEIYAGLGHKASLRYQGYAPTGLSKEEAAKYLNLPERARHVLPMAEAKELGLRLSQGSIKDQLGVINEMLAGYDEQTQFVAFNDLVEFAKIPPSLQLAYLNQGKTWLNEYIDVALNPKAIEKLTPEKQEKFSTELDGNAGWHQFVRSMYAGGQRLEEVEAWRAGIIAYGNALSAAGAKPDAAMKTSFQRLIADNLGFPTVHGQPVMVQKVRRDGTVRTDPEIQDYGRRLTTALKDIPPQHIQTTDENGLPYFLTLPQLPEDDPKRLQHLRDIITSQGYYRPSPDGQSVSLYMLDSDGVEFQVRDKHNRPIEADLDDLPTFSKTTPSIVFMGSKYSTDKISKTYDGPVNGWAPYWKNQRKEIPPRIKELRAP